MARDTAAKNKKYIEGLYLSKIKEKLMIIMQKVKQVSAWEKINLSIFLHNSSPGNLQGLYFQVKILVSWWPTQIHLNN